MQSRSLILAFAALIVLALALYISVSLLPAPPLYPTPTWPKGIDLPDKLSRIPR